jgi:chemotaxis protein MotB
MAIQAAFEQFGVFPTTNAKLPLDLTTIPLPVAPATDDPKKSPAKLKLSFIKDDEVATLQQELQEALHKEIASHAIALHRESEGLVISLREFGFFDSGSASLRPDALPALDRIASILAVRTCRVRIEGHTDNIPIHTPQMPSNWELSTARSTELVRLLLVRHRFLPERLSAAGYAEFHPIVSNDTPKAGLRIGRVDLVILTEHLANDEVARDEKPSPSIP